MGRAGGFDGIKVTRQSTVRSSAYRIGEWEEQISVWGHSFMRTKSVLGNTTILGQIEFLEFGSLGAEEMALQLRALTRRTQVLFQHLYQIAHWNSGSRESDTP